MPRPPIGVSFAAPSLGTERTWPSSLAPEIISPRLRRADRRECLGFRTQVARGGPVYCGLVIELSAVSLFAGLPDKELAAIGRRLTEIRQPAGKQVVMAGSTGAAFLILLEGEADVELPGGVRRTLRPGDYYGEMALIDEAGRSATVTAKSDLCLLGMSKWEFKPFVADHPEVAWRLLTTLSRRLREAEAKLGPTEGEVD